MPTNTNILLIRHGEKPDSDTDPTLTVAGQERAQAYVVYFQNYAISKSSAPLKLGYLFAAADSNESHRPVLTITPLADALNLAINQTYPDSGYSSLATDILGDSSYDSANLLICWHHEEILELAQALGVNPSSLPVAAAWPKTWPNSVYGWVLQLVYGADGQIDVTQTRCLNEKLMDDDHGQDPPGANPEKRTAEYPRAAVG